MMMQTTHRLVRPRLFNMLQAILSGAYWVAKRQLKKITESADSAMTKKPKSGYLRGIDYYTPFQINWVLAKALLQYKKKYTQYPNLVEPKSFNEKVIWFKFFGLIKIPQSGNKLETFELVPEDFRDSVICLPIVWHSENPKLPENDEMTPGVYYLKANHGSGMFDRITYPLTQSKRFELEEKGRKWLERDFGWHNGEWWYNTFTPSLMIERCVTGNSDSISWNFYVLNGKISIVGLSLKTIDGKKYATWLDHDFRELSCQSELPPVPSYDVGSKQNEMMKIALGIARSFSSIRVDFLLGENEQIYLCELTFSPGNGTTRRPQEVDALLTAGWEKLI